MFASLKSSLKELITLSFTFNIKDGPYQVNSFIQKL